MKCEKCDREIAAGQDYDHQGKLLCEKCRLNAGLFPLGHTGHLKQSFFIKDRKG